jgi:hypothetical protein
MMIAATLFTQLQIIMKNVAVVAETDYFEDLKHGWEYALSRLVEQYKQRFVPHLYESIHQQQIMQITKKKKEIIITIIKFPLD